MKSNREKRDRTSKAFVILKVFLCHHDVLESRSNPFYLVEYTFILSDERQSTRSPTISRTDSYRDGPMSNPTDRPYQQRSSITEDIEREDNDYEEPSNESGSQERDDRPPPRREDQYIAALRYRFPNRPKTDYAYKQPVGPAGIFIYKNK